MPATPMTSSSSPVTKPRCMSCEAQLATLRLELAADKTRLMTTSAGAPFRGFVFRPGLRPRVLGGHKAPL